MYGLTMRSSKGQAAKIQCRRRLTFGGDGVTYARGTRRSECGGSCVVGGWWLPCNARAAQTPNVNMERDTVTTTVLLHSHHQLVSRHRFSEIL